MADMGEERVFHGKRDIEYMFMEGAEGCPYLMIIFQAIPSAKNNFEKKYGYKKILSDINLHRLYIKDSYGLLGCFYMCENMDFSIEESVAMLINDIMVKYGIKKENVITCGSSKGGTCALYYGAKYGLGHAICGAPQSRVGSFICSVNKETAQFMMGEDLPEENIEFINRIVLKQLNPQCVTDIRILTSENDGQFAKHIVPLLARAEETGVYIDVTANDRIKSHHDIARYYSDYLKSNILDILFSDLKCKRPEVNVGKSGFKISNAFDESGKIKFTVSITDGGQETLMQETIEDEQFEYSTDKIMSLSIFLDMLVDGEKWITYSAADIVIDQGYFKYNGYEVDIDYENKRINFKIDIEDEDDSVRYYYNLTSGKEQIVPSFSSREKFQSFEVQESGKYKINFSIKIKDIGKIKKRTPTMHIDFDKSIEKE